MNGCKYCVDDWGQRFSVCNNKYDSPFSSIGGFQVDRGRLLVNVGGLVASFPVNYCPVCGRQLENEFRIEDYELK